MNEEILRKSICWLCANREYTSVFTPSGKYERNWECLYPQHRHHFGRLKEAVACPDFEDEAAVEARLMGGL